MDTITQERDCDKLASALRAATNNVIERMRESYHRFDPTFADEAVEFLKREFGPDFDFDFDTFVED